MDGITVLYEFTQRESWAMCIIFIGSTIGIAALITAFFCHDDIDILVPSIVIVLLCLILVGFSLASDAHDNFQKVLIDNSVNLVEFNEHYKIISQEGKIYTVKLIEQKEGEQDV